MIYPLSILSIFLLVLIHLTSAHSHHHDHSHTSIPSSTRTHWMRRANLALHELSSPCPFGAFGTAIVNHTDLSTGPHGRLICLGVNDVASGNPTLHGEVAAINNCSRLFRASEEEGGFGMNGEQAGNAWKDLSLYTNGEPCPMCATAIRWAGFKECIYSVSARRLKELGWPQIEIRAHEVFRRSDRVSGTETTLIKDVLESESEHYFAWQYDAKSPCPKGCKRTEDGAFCTSSEDQKDEL